MVQPRLIGFVANRPRPVAERPTRVELAVMSRCYRLKIAMSPSNYCGRLWNPDGLGTLQCRVWAPMERDRHLARIFGNHSRSLSDDRLRLRIRRIDNPALRADDSSQRRAAADGQLGRCYRKLAGMVVARAQHLEQAGRTLTFQTR